MVEGISEETDEGVSPWDSEADALVWIQKEKKDISRQKQQERAMERLRCFMRESSFLKNIGEKQQMGSSLLDDLDSGVAVEEDHKNGSAKDPGDGFGCSDAGVAEVGSDPENGADLNDQL